MPTTPAKPVQLLRALTLEEMRKVARAHRKRMRLGRQFLTQEAADAFVHDTAMRGAFIVCLDDDVFVVMHLGNRGVAEGDVDLDDFTIADEPIDVVAEADGGPR